DFGAAYVFSGAPGHARLFRFEGDQAGALFGDSVGGTGDVNRDGHADIVVGAPFYDVDGRRDAGRAYVYSGADGTQLYRFDGEFAIDGVGWDVDGAGDMNGDGYDDILVSAPHTDPSGFRNSGSVWAYSGKNGTLLWRHNGTNALDYFGSACAAAGDLNGDGVPDAVAGAPTADPGGKEIAGSVYMLSGVNGAILRVFHGSDPYLY
ncbi:FG-GAP repeat protein, partial [bacterium]|nr:FG-GAP repeat protein [bacterium]